MESIVKRTITPDVARDMLSRNYDGNRNIRKAYARQLAEVMRDGRFVSDNGQTIVVGRDGTLYDGQHRLTALVESGVTLDFYVFTTDDENVYKTIDNGTRRRAGDFINGPNATNMAAIARIAACVSQGDSPLLTCLQGRVTPNTEIDRAAIVDFVNANKDEMSAITSAANKMRSAAACGPVTVYGTFLHVVRFCDRDLLLDEFVEDFCNLAPDSATVSAAKATIQRSYVKRATPARQWLLGILLDAYEHYLKMDNSTTFNRGPKRITEYSKLVEVRRSLLNDARGDA